MKNQVDELTRKLANQEKSMQGEREGNEVERQKAQKELETLRLEIKSVRRAALLSEHRRSDPGKIHG